MQLLLPLNDYSSNEMYISKSNVQKRQNAKTFSLKCNKELLCFRLAVNQLCSVVVSDAIVWHPLPTVIPSSISSKSSASLPDMEQLEQNKFQKDLLRVELE